MKFDDPLFSRNARPQKALVGRAQWQINQPPSLKRERANLKDQLDRWWSFDAHRKGTVGALRDAEQFSSTLLRSNSWSTLHSGTWRWGGYEYTLRERTGKSDLPVISCKQGRLE
jgi:hypothetical protein